ncbi:hypothetical protein LTR10_021094 [Elasticomyces elasticus]|uniref:NAD(P)-binding domain-containing protein n=1 Tax=Exophiala sideris TaxID=1016849 RepID=A0ABR0J6G3_9EURO|nr:hypothetical protein LTR10_021094 [Elasticomyces elasticus]KAK5028891.1 hypothetical protein LTS07_006272 [Exophiala sideris]KAK5035760.1 hypothetical protein LTR13_005891 [Exophiala sideris]KAK5057395.1 hypothetical protein LTR69_007436 [Exophiala sideris]KAK5181629.1 hypothetical protein LTR44_005828 [Eurotiomycetes sp. CCFEE 6388]
MPSVLLIGATGLIGTHLAADIKRSHPEWPLTAFYRNRAADEYFKSTAHVDRIVHGSFSDTELVRSLSKEHDIVINAASSFDADLINLIISGMEDRPSTSSKGTLIHLSGTGNFIDYGTTGNFNPESKVWNDANEEDIKLINKDMFNGPTDVPVLEAGQRGKITTYIVCLAVTSGQSAFNPTANLGVGYNIFVSLAKGLGFVPYVGDGTGVVSTVHVLDAVPFITKIVGVAGTQEPQGSAYSRYYILHGERLQWKDFSTALAKVLYTKGIVSSPEPKKISMDEAGVGEVKHLIAANMLVKGDRAAKLGFKPVQPSMLVSMQKDLGEHVF